MTPEEFYTETSYEDMWFSDHEFNQIFKFAKAYAEQEIKELKEALTGMVDFTTDEFAERFGFLPQREKAIKLLKK